VDLLLQRLRGESFASEWPVPTEEPAVAAAPLADVRQATVALVTEGGCVPRGNPDRIPSAWSTHWATYDLPPSGALTPDAYTSIHGGSDQTYIRQDPHRLVPLDVARELADEGAVGRLWERLISTCGNMASIGTGQRFGREMAAALHAQGVEGVILTAT
jgi:glycine reductase